MKINAIEILMNISQFAPAAALRTFVLSEDQKIKGYPFIKRLTHHLLYSFEQGMKVQVFEFFKILLDNEQTEKKVEFNDMFYKEILHILLSFIQNAEDINDVSEEENKEDVNMTGSEDFIRAKNNYNRALDYSRSLVVSILTKFASEHAFRFRIFSV